MTMDGVKLRRRTAEVIARAGGRTMTVQVPTVAGTYNPSTGTITGAVYTDVVVSATPPLAYALGYRGSDTVKEGDAQVIVGAEGLTFRPEAGMKVTIDTETWTVINVIAHAIGTTTIAYELQVRRGSS